MENKKHDKELTSTEEQELFSKLEFSYSKSKEDVWGALEGLMDDEPAQAAPVAKPARIIRMNWASMSIAASMVLLLSYGLFARFYTTTISVAAGEFTSHILPDGSEVHLNAASSITYSPYWWKFDRKVKLAGEAFFEVEKGEKFSVHSEFAITEVLGTKFNIYAREGDYEVFCETGKVGVSSDFSKQVVLTPGQSVRLERSQLEIRNTEESKEAILSWRNNEFNYNTTPLSKVFDDLERHYGITIKLEEENIASEGYTGAFPRPKTVKEALAVIQVSDWTYEKTGENSFLIKKK